MKVKPVVDALERHNAEVVLVHTGQHYDANMSEVFFSDLGLRFPDCYLGVGSGSHAEQTAAVMRAFEPVVERERPDVVVVVGDVNSTMAAAVVAAKAGPLVAHVEAGLRSWDWSMPEEINRVVTDRVSDFLLAPSADAVENLRAEGYGGDQIRLVGNVMIDTLFANLERARDRPVLRKLGLTARQYGVVTLHRPANVDDPTAMAKLASGLGAISLELPLILPAHPRSRTALACANLPPSVQVIDPIGYLDFIALEASARLVLTDSGGVQEETTALGVPCLTLRDNTERPITVTEGTNEVVGRRPEVMIAAAQRILRDGVAPRCPPLWDGRAGERIGRVLAEPTGRRRPMDRTG